jgi:hypothetical protein
MEGRSGDDASADKPDYIGDPCSGEDELTQCSQQEQGCNDAECLGNGTQLYLRNEFGLTARKVMWPGHGIGWSIFKKEDLTFATGS